MINSGRLVTNRGEEEVDGDTLRPFSESLPMLLLKAREASMRAFRPMLAAHDLTEQQWRVLRALTSLDGAPEVTALADITFLLAPSLSRIITKLEDRGLISRDTVPQDQRRALISLTRAGIELVAEIAPQSEALYSLIENHLPHERFADLMEGLQSLAEFRIDDI